MTLQTLLIFLGIDVALSIVVWLLARRWESICSWMKNLWFRQGRSRITEIQLRQMTQSLTGDRKGLYYALVISDDIGHIRGLCSILDSDNLTSAKVEAEDRFYRILEVWDQDFEIDYAIWRIGDE